MADRFWEKILQLAPPPWLGDYDETDDGEARISCGAWLDILTRQLAILPPQERLEFAEISTAQDAEIIMCLVPASVVLSWMGHNKRREEFHFSSLDTPLGELFPSHKTTARRRRLISFPVTILVIAAELAADTWQRRSTDLPFPPSGSIPESENASDPGRPEASTRTNRPRKPRVTGTLRSPETKRVCVDYQVHSGSRGLRPLSEEPQGNDTRSEDPSGFGLFAAGFA